MKAIVVEAGQLTIQVVLLLMLLSECLIVALSEKQYCISNH
jgi:hypothetical protein